VKAISSGERRGNILKLNFSVLKKYIVKVVIKTELTVQQYSKICNTLGTENKIITQFIIAVKLILIALAVKDITVVY
jgi:hypothetical protein